MDTFLAIASRRETKRFDGSGVPDDVRRRILDAGRLAGSGKNRQPWTFVVGEPARFQPFVFDSRNLDGAAFAVAIVVSGKGPISFDAGRAAQNMLLAAWNDGVGATPNGIADRDGAARALGLAADEQLATILAFGHGRRQRDPSRHSAEEWSARAVRRTLDDVVREL